MDQMGCGCWMPAKARMLDANCWIFEQTGTQIQGNGWTPGTNGDEMPQDFTTKKLTDPR